MNWILLGFLAINLTLATLGDIAAKIWAINSSPKWFLVSLGINIVTVITFMFVVREGGLAIGSSIALLLTMITLTCAGFFIFHEHITLSQWVGIGLGILSASLMLGLLKFS
jgi:hypothetical protein